MDKVMLFTDMQIRDTNHDQLMVKRWKEYKEISPDSRLYLFDLAGHGQAPVDIRREDVYLIGGWSDKVFAMLAALEKGSDALEKIRKIEL